MRKPWLSLLPGLCVLLACSNRGPDDVVGPTTTTGNPSIAIRDSNNKPVPSVLAKVYLVKSSLSPEDSTSKPEYDLRATGVSDSTGMLRFEPGALVRGKYFLDFTHPTSRSAAFQTKEITDPELVSDTVILKPTGSISGYVWRGSLDPSVVKQWDGRLIVVGIQGTSRSVVTTSWSGKYRFDTIPEGSYELSYYCDKFLPASKVNVMVRSDSTTQVGKVTLELSPVGPPPAPGLIRAYLDSARQVVNLVWEPVAVSDLFGYEVVRMDTMRNQQLLTPVLTRTSYTDSIRSLPSGTRVLYAARAVDVAGNRGPNTLPAEITIRHIE